MALTSVPELHSIISATLSAAPLPLAQEKIAVWQAGGRVLAQDISAAVNLPSTDLSAMDGYALHSAEAYPQTQLRLIGESSAGAAFTGTVPAGACVRIMTGAPVPSDCDCVIMQEKVDVNQNIITLNSAVMSGENIRRRGEEFQQGTPLFTAGHLLRRADVPLLAAQGLAQISVYAPLKVAVFSGGNELCAAGETLPDEAHLYDSNRPMLLASLRDFPVEILDYAHLADDPQVIEEQLKKASTEAQVIISTGGVSVGDYDYMRTVVERIGKIHHYRVAMKPGKPFVFGSIAQAWYFGLPGNPVSSFVAFDVFLRAALWQIAGAAPLAAPLRLRARLSKAVKKSTGRMEFQRVHLYNDAQGVLLADATGSQDSHRILGLARANAYAVLPEEAHDLLAGEEVDVLLFADALQ